MLWFSIGFSPCFPSQPEYKVKQWEKSNSWILSKWNWTKIDSKILIANWTLEWRLCWGGFCCSGLGCLLFTQLLLATRPMWKGECWERDIFLFPASRLKNWGSWRFWRTHFWHRSHRRNLADGDKLLSVTSYTNTSSASRAPARFAGSHQCSKC